MFSKKSIILAILFSLFIYSEYFGVSNKLINSIAILYSYYLIFRLDKKELFGSGFIIGLLWFWWMGYSFIYYDLSYLIPIILVAVASAYGLLFYLGGIFNNILYRLIYFIAFSYLEPFGFNWLKLELPLIDSYFGTSKIEFIILLSLSAYLAYSKIIKKRDVAIYTIALIGLYFFHHLNTPILKKSDLKINLNNTNIAQEIKWDNRYLPKILQDNLANIEKSIKAKDDIIIFPETSFPLILNRQPKLLDMLLEYSNDISIVLGALYEKDGFIYNSTYLFENNKMQIANKVVLVPFGEAVPLPKLLRDFINDSFYGGAEDYKTAKKPTTFTIKGVKFRNAICYEATTDKIYENLDTSYAIATSNNAWFIPSIQPTLQKLLLRYYSDKYHIYIYSVTNGK